MHSEPEHPDHYLRLTGLSKVYGGAVALDAIDLDVHRGEFLTLLGGSGSGKTTTLNCIAGFVAASSGTIELDGTMINRLPAHKRNVGVVFQHYALFPHMTVAENVAYPLRARRVPRAQIAERVAEALRTVRLEAYADRVPAALSGGQQQRVAMARAVVYRPDLLLLDEPLGALDKNLREQLQLEIMRLHRELGITVIAVTHDQEEALTMSDRIAVYRSGRIAQIGTASELYTEPNSRFVAEFIGESNAFVGAAVVGSAGHRVNVDGLGSLVTPPFDPAVISGRAVLIVRPEDMRIQRVGDVAPGYNALAARVVDSVYVGSSRKYIVRTADGVERQVRVAASPDGFDRGDAVEVCWSGNAGRVLDEDAAA